MPTGWLRRNHGRHQMLGRPQSNWRACTAGDDARRESHLEEFLAVLMELNVRLLSKPTIPCLGKHMSTRKLERKHLEQFPERPRSR